MPKGEYLLWNLDTDELVGNCIVTVRPCGKSCFIPQKPWLHFGQRGRRCSRLGLSRTRAYPPSYPPASSNRRQILRFGKLCLTPDGKWLFATSHGKCCNGTFGRITAITRMRTSWACQTLLPVAVLGGNQWLLAGGDDAHPDVVVRPLRKLEEVERVLHGHSDLVRCLAPLPDGNTFLSGSDDGTVRKLATPFERSNDCSAQSRSCRRSRSPGRRMARRCLPDCTREKCWLLRPTPS